MVDFSHLMKYSRCQRLDLIYVKELRKQSIEHDRIKISIILDSWRGTDSLLVDKDMCLVCAVREPIIFHRDFVP